MILHVLVRYMQAMQTGNKKRRQALNHHDRYKVGDNCAIAQLGKKSLAKAVICCALQSFLFAP